MSVGAAALLARAAVGRQVKIVRRLGVSDTPVTLHRPGDRQVLQVRRHRHAVAGADARVDQRVIDRREQVVDRPDRPRHERRGDALRTGLDRDRRRLERQTLFAGVAHAVVDFEHRDALAVDRDLEQLVLPRHVDGGVAEQLAADRAHAASPGTCRGRRPGTCARTPCRRAIRTACPRRSASGSRSPARGTSRSSADAARSPTARRLIWLRRAQVALRQRRRKRLRVGDVVEALAHRVGRKKRGHVDVDVEQVPDRLRVLGARQALERTPAGIGIGGRPPIHPRLERCDADRADLRVVGAPWLRRAASCRRAACG